MTELLKVVPSHNIRMPDCGSGTNDSIGPAWHAPSSFWQATSKFWWNLLTNTFENGWEMSKNSWENNHFVPMGSLDPPRVVVALQGSFIHHYNIHSNRHSCPNRHSPLFTIKLLVLKNRWNELFLYSKCMNLRSDFEPIIMHQPCLAHAQCAPIRMNTVYGI